MKLGVLHAFRFEVEADLLNVHVDFPLFERLAKPVAAGRTKLPGITIHDTRMLRLRSRRRIPPARRRCA